MVDFKIEITKERVSVSDAKAGWPPDSGTIIVFLLAGFTIYTFWTRLTRLELWLNPSNWLLLPLMTAFAGTILWAAFRNLFPTGESLTCDGTTLTIGRIPRGSLRGQWRYESFPISAVKELQFAPVAYGRTPLMGIVFKIDREKKKTLGGLDSPEAAQILDALASLGINIVRDPAMTMMVEMALSRRKHFGGLL